MVLSFALISLIASPVMHQFGAKDRKSHYKFFLNLFCAHYGEIRANNIVCICVEKATAVMTGITATTARPNARPNSCLSKPLHHCQSCS